MTSEAGKGSLPVVTIRNLDSRATVYLHGGHCASWIVDNKERLFVSDKAVFQPPKAIRGGIPICWPQFGDMGPVTAQHGFARNSEFVVTDRTAHSATLTLKGEEGSHPEFPFAFELSTKIELTDERSLRQELMVRNTGDKPFPFTAALHTYFRTPDIATTHIEGLQGCKYLDSLQGRKECREEQSQVAFPGEVDRIYCDAPNTLSINNSSSSIKVVKSGFPDVVLWNPHIEKAAAMSDFGDDEWRRMLCLEVAQAGSGAVEVGPGETWCASQTVQVEDH